MPRPKPPLAFWSIWNMSFGFLGIQFGFALQNANVSRIFETLGARVENIPILWIAAPVTGRIAYLKHTPGQYLNAMRADCAKFNENVLIGIESVEPAGVKVGVRLIAGVIARRIVPFVQVGEEVSRGGRISLIQFGSRADVYLPLSATIKVTLDQKVVGGETILALLE